MSVLSPRRDAELSRAIHEIRERSRGQTLMGSTVLAHAVRVVRTLEDYQRVTPVLATGLILHDLPNIEGDKAEHAALLQTFPVISQLVVHTIDREHSFMTPESGEGYNPGLQKYVQGLRKYPIMSAAVAADKMVAMESIRSRADSAEDEVEFWRARSAFRSRIPYFEGFLEGVSGQIPDRLTADLGNLVASLSVRSSVVNEE